MTAWPTVLSEIDTLDLVLSGRSLARYGDGELHLCEGGAAKAQAADPAIKGRLRGILKSSGHCLVGIPNLRSETPKADFWKPFEKHAGLLPDREYASSFVTRPDSAPWIDTESYWGKVAQLWLGRDVLLVRGGERSFTASDLWGAKRVTEVVGPPVNAWRQYGRMLEQIMAYRPKRALLCLGPTATVMAVDLCANGVQAIDLGHIGMFWKKHIKGEPMLVTDQDKAVA
jgi:hypothetical protein